MDPHPRVCWLVRIILVVPVAVLSASMSCARLPDLDGPGLTWDEAKMNLLVFIVPGDYPPELINNPIFDHWLKWVELSQLHYAGRTNDAVKGMRERRPWGAQYFVRFVSPVTWREQYAEEYVEIGFFRPAHASAARISENEAKRRFVARFPYDMASWNGSDFYKQWLQDTGLRQLSKEDLQKMKGG